MDNKTLLHWLNVNASNRKEMLSAVLVPAVKLDRFLADPEENPLVEEDRQKLVYWCKGYYVYTSLSDGYELRVPPANPPRSLGVKPDRHVAPNIDYGDPCLGGNVSAGTVVRQAQIPPSDNDQHRTKAKASVLAQHATKAKAKVEQLINFGR